MWLGPLSSAQHRTPHSSSTHHSPEIRNCLRGEEPIFWSHHPPKEVGTVIRQTWRCLQQSGRLSSEMLFRRQAFGGGWSIPSKAPSPGELGLCSCSPRGKESCPACKFQDPLWGSSQAPPRTHRPQHAKGWTEPNPCHRLAKAKTLADSSLLNKEAGG